MIRFGNTWWGKMWLYALEGIDFENRLPRGKTYARKGAVREIIFTGASIFAYVAGSRPLDYETTIILEPLSEEEKGQIIETVIDNPLYLAKLLNRELPHELYDELKGAGIELFPESWDDITASCSCPDWALPCKHLAAVIYMLANRIDSDPFLICKLRGFDILAELERRDYRIGPNGSVQIKSAGRIIEDSLLQAAEPPNVESPQEPDLSRISPMADHLLSLLTERPLFYLHGNFKWNLSWMYSQIQKKAELLLNDEPERPLNERCQVELTLKPDLLNVQIKLTNCRGLPKLSPLELFEALLVIPAADLESYEDELVALQRVARFAMTLLQQSAFIPELVAISPESYIIRWIPPLHNSLISELFETILALTPPGLVRLEQEGQMVIMQGKEQLFTLLSLFCGDFIAEHYHNGKKHELVEALFFKRFPLDISERYDLEEVPGQIALWLSPFYLCHSNFVPIIRIDETEEPDLLAVSLMVKERGGQMVEFSRIFEDEEWREIRTGIMKDVLLLSSYLFELESLIQSRGRIPLLIELSHFTPILLDVLPAIKLLGIQIILPKGLKELVRPGASLILKGQAQESSVSYLNLNKLLSFQWQIALGGQMVDVEEFAREVAGLEGLVKYRDQYLFIDPKEIERLLKEVRKEPKLKKGELLAAALEESYHEEVITLDPGAHEIFRRLLSSSPVEPPSGLKGVLRPYQLEGYRWLYRNSMVGLGSIIADDMGLGKTIQVISLLLKFKEERALVKKKVLIVVPTTLLSNWEHELSRFAPELRYLTYHGAGRSFEPEGVELIITSYGILRSENELFSAINWQAVVIDEAQNIKNSASSQSRAVKGLKSKVKIAMSGTPVENRLSEYWSIFDFINKGYLGSRKSFHRDYARPIEVYRDEERLKSFIKRTSPFILRRLKSDRSIIGDLPAKLESDHFTTLTSRQAALYQTVVDEGMKKVKESLGIERRGLILKLLTSLKQICNHPVHFLKEGEPDPELSGKSRLLLTLLERIYSNNAKVLIFTQYREMGELLAQMIEAAFGHRPEFLHGGVSRKRRDAMVKEFQEEHSCRTLLLSLKAGGTGLNLTAASAVIHYDLWWNPAVESQATDRAYRIGQQQNVTVYRLITEKSMEERIDEMLKEKEELAELTVSGGGSWIGDLANSELEEIVRIE